MTSGGDFGLEKRELTTCFGAPGLSVYSSLRRDPAGSIAFVRSCMFLVGQRLFEARFVCKQSLMGSDGPLLDRITRSASFGRAAH